MEERPGAVCGVRCAVRGVGIRGSQVLQSDTFVTIMAQLGRANRCVRLPRV